MSAPKKRIPTSGPQTGLNAAFAGLKLDGLAPGPEAVEQAPLSAPVAAKSGRVVLRRETAHRGGKTVLVVDGFGAQHSESAIEALAKRLRAACGCGGTVRERTVELQGDFPAKIRHLLEADGFVVAGER
jgi:translation initiation factor 1